MNMATSWNLQHYYNSMLCVLVDDSEIASSSIFDQETIEKAYCQRQGWGASLGNICGDWHRRLGAIIAIVIWQLKQPDPSPTSSPIFHFLV